MSYKKKNIYLVTLNFAIIIILILFNVYLRAQTIIVIDDTNGSSVVRVIKRYADYIDELTIISITILVTCMAVTITILIIDNLNVSKRLDFLVKQFDDVGLSKINVNNEILSDYDLQVINAWNRSVSEVDYLNELREKYFKNMIHDLKTPIQLLSINTKMLKMEYGDDEYLEALEEELITLEQSVINFLMIEKITYFEKVKKTQINIIDYFERIKQRYMHMQYRVNFENPHQLKWILADEDMLNRIVENIVENAIKYGSDKQIKIEIYRDKIVFINKVAENLELGNIFEKERTYSIMGNGLGTDIINTYVKLLGWSVSSESSDDEFRVIVNY